MNRNILKYGGFVLGIISGFLIGLQTGMQIILSEISRWISTTTSPIVEEVTQSLYNYLLNVFIGQFSPPILDRLYFVAFLVAVSGFALIYYSRPKKETVAP